MSLKGQNKSLLLINTFLIFIRFTSASKCPNNWIDAIDLDLGCLSFSDSEAMTWKESEMFCKNWNDSHLVEIFSQSQQDSAH